MPAWEDRLTEEQVWQVIYYLYETTGARPRVMTEGHGALPPPPGRAVAGLAERAAGALGPPPAEAQGADRGKELYERYCALCHGAGGKGDGPAAELLLPAPRDFTAGKFKIRTTPSGQLPTDEDLSRIIRDGMPGTSMPAWGQVIKDAKDMQALVAYVKTFAEGFKGAKLELAKVPPEVASSDASIKRGKEMFEAIECFKCHGKAGRGDPDPGSDLKDDWGHPVRPANLTKPWTFRGGHERKDVAARLSTGLMGTPMPTFIDSVEKPEDIWHVTNYVRSLGPDRPNWASVLQVRAAGGEVPSDPNHEFWKKIPAANFPLVGQVIVDPRNFNPSVDLLTVRAVHTPGEVVFHLTWDDPTASDPAKGAPKPDAVALQLPAPGLTERPYFLMGDTAKPVYLLTWTAGPGVGEATAQGVGKVTPQAGEAVQAKGQVVYDAGQYRAVIRRPRETPDKTDFVFPAADFFPIAFWVWDGSEGEAGAKAAVSTWYHVRLEAASSGRTFVIPPIAALGTVALELGLLRWVRRRRAAAA
jgi:DMSO reductase family type II enzyme heme b subunit